VRRLVAISLGVLTMLAGVALAAPADAVMTPAPGDGPPVGVGGWNGEAIGPFDGPAGLVCDFAVHWDVVENQVAVKTVQTYPDGSPKQQIADGALLLNVSNADTGKSEIADASGRATFDIGTDGSQVWHVVGPIIARLPAGRSNLPRGLYTIDGIYTVTFTPGQPINITLTNGSMHNLCDDLA
jgi:hypothetical protein